MTVVYLKPGRDKPLHRRHPWIFSKAIFRVEGNPGMGETVEIRNSDGHFLAWGAFSPESQIRLRVWSWNLNDIIGPKFLYNKLEKAIQYRTSLFNNFDTRHQIIDYDVSTNRRMSTAVRLVNAESDGMPGLIVDKYGDTLVLQFLSAGADRWRGKIVELLLELIDFEHILERSDVDVRKLEGLPERILPLYGKPPSQIEILENNLRFSVDLTSGHKTGFYLDQRLNRERVQSLASGKEVLDCFSYSGGFTVSALSGGAKFVTAVDRSKKALALAHENVKLNQLPNERVETLEADVFKQLRKFRDQARRFDLIILDPPKFAPTLSLVQRATRGYKDINLLAFKLLRPGGLLVTFSCSGGLDEALFQKIVASAALDAGVSAKIVSRLEQSPDHPVSLSFPEGAYLKGLILRVA
ncbi:class I SAM-dependent rRNA methyltransferase [Chloroflexota bacterium]